MTKIFISGCTGFIGSVLSEKLVNKNNEVYALCRNVTDRKIDLHRDINIVWGDLVDGHFLKKTLRQINPDIVVHLAAQSSVAYSHEHPQENAEITYIGTINLQKASEGLSNLEKFIFSGTSEEYGNQLILPIKESAPLLPNQPYAIAKVAADEYLNYCKESTGFPSLTLRPFNTYGRTKNHSFVTESIIYQMLTQKEVFLGDPHPIRDLMYVDDHVNGYIRAIETPYSKLESVRAINLCTGVGTSIKELAKLIGDIMSYDGKITWKVHTRPTEIDKLIGNNSLAKDKLKWTPKYTLEQGLLKTIEFWGKQFVDRIL